MTDDTTKRDDFDNKSTGMQDDDQDITKGGQSSNQGDLGTEYTPSDDELEKEEGI